MMKLSTRGRYATRVLLDLALRWGAGPVQLKDIARNQQVSVMYLEHLIRPLIASGIVRSMRGARGGVWLGKPPEEIRLSQVIGLLEGSTDPVGCLDDPNTCPRANFCVTRDIWAELKKAVDQVLESITLQDLVERQRRKEHPAEKMHSI